LFAIDGVVRLADGRVFRGVANLAIGTAILVASKRRGAQRLMVREEPSLPDAAASRRLAWGRSHPVLVSLVAGVMFGGAFAAYLAATNEGPILLAGAVGLAAGIVFGPTVVILTRRIERAGSDRPRVE